MKFGSIVHVTLPGIEGKVLGKYLGGLDCEVKVRLLEVTPSQVPGAIVWVKPEEVTPAPLFPPTAKCHGCQFHVKAPGAQFQMFCQMKYEPLTCGVGE